MSIRIPYELLVFWRWCHVATDSSIIGSAGILGVAAISVAAISQGMDGAIVASGVGAIVTIIQIIILKRFIETRKKR